MKDLFVVGKSIPRVDAVGVRTKELPITPDKVLKALRKKR